VADSLVARGPRRAAEQKEGYDPARLRRALALAVKPLGPGLYRVQGQHERYYDVAVNEDVPCYCKDAEYHGKGCKHFLACKLQERDPALVDAIGQMLLAAFKANEELTRKTRKRRKIA
jgi:hypothetical protein